MFWACKTSFEKLFSRALRFCKHIEVFPLKKSKKNQSEDRLLLTIFIDFENSLFSGHSDRSSYNDIQFFKIWNKLFSNSVFLCKRF